MADFDIEAYLEAQIDGGGSKKTSDEVKDSSGRSRDRDRDRDRDRERRRSRSDSRDRRSKRDRDRDSHRGSRRRDRSRSRSPSKSDRRRRDRSSERSRPRRSRSSERRRDKDREPRRASREKDVAVVPKQADDEARKLKAIENEHEKEKKRQQKEIDDLTKDQRTVFVSQLTMKTDERNVEEYFGLVGKVNEVIMIRDKFTKKHKGFCYVEMADLESIPMVLQLSGIVPDFQKFPILVKASEAEKNFLAKKDGAAAGVAGQGGSDCKVYIGNLHVNLTEHDLQGVLSRFGVIESISLQRDEIGNSKGYAFVRYMKPEEAATAMAQLGGMELAGRIIRVGHVNDPSSSAGGSSGASSAAAAGGSGSWKLDDDEGSGMQMNSQSRSMLMAKLGAAAGMAPPAPVANIYGPGAGGNGVPAIAGLPSTCIMIKNMFVLEEETDPNWDADIKEDVMEECGKYGKVNHAHVETKVPGGFVYLRFAAVEAASEAARNLNGRFFAGKMITVAYVNPAEYQAKFF